MENCKIINYKKRKKEHKSYKIYKNNKTIFDKNKDILFA